jgi:hypothetical protein
MGFPFHDKLPWLWDQWVFLPITSYNDREINGFSSPW